METKEQTAERRISVLRGFPNSVIPTRREIVEAIARSDAEAGMVLVPISLLIRCKNTAHAALNHASNESWRMEHQQVLDQVCAMIAASEDTP